jgi:hypothetical protein
MSDAKMERISVQFGAGRRFLPCSHADTLCRMSALFGVPALPSALFSNPFICTCPCGHRASLWLLFGGHWRLLLHWRCISLLRC